MKSLRRYQSNQPVIEVQFTCDHCGGMIEPDQHGMVLWKGDGEEFKILHAGQCTKGNDHFPFDAPLYQVGTKSVVHRMYLRYEKMTLKLR